MVGQGDGGGEGKKLFCSWVRIGTGPPLIAEIKLRPTGDMGNLTRSHNDI